MPDLRMSKGEGAQGGLAVKAIRIFYRGYFIDLEEDEQEGWRTVSIAHSKTNRKLSPPLTVSTDDVTTEGFARAAVDEHLATMFRDAARRARLAAP